MKVGDLVRYREKRHVYLVTWINERFMRVMGGSRSFRYTSAEWTVISEAG